MTTTGDVLLQYDPLTNECDIAYENGQPAMTDGFETCVLLAIFGESGPMNGMTDNPDERMNSEFPAVVRRAKVNDETKVNGEKAIERALAFLVSSKAASSVAVTGKIISAFAIGWDVEIVAPTGKTRYSINWEKGLLTARGYR
jgi:phage gp46-like protein